MKKQWRCFHCDAVFTREVDATEHFGGSQASLAACQIKGHEHNLISVIRDQELQLQRYRQEDGEIMRAMLGLQCEHSEALRRAEELGFSRGVQGMQVHAYNQFGRTIEL